MHLDMMAARVDYDASNGRVRGKDRGWSAVDAGGPARRVVFTHDDHTPAAHVHDCFYGIDAALEIDNPVARTVLHRGRRFVAEGCGGEIERRILKMLAHLAGPAHLNRVMHDPHAGERLR